MNSRDKFEAWIISSPYERSVGRQNDKGGWPGQYRSYETQLAWEAWQESARQTREECAKLCETAWRKGLGEPYQVAAAIRKMEN